MKTKRVDLSKLTAEQREAFIQLVKDAKSVAPQWEEMQQLAQTIYTEFLKSPEFTLKEAPRDGERPQEFWHVKPEINYVDHIEEA